MPLIGVAFRGQVKKILPVLFLYLFLYFSAKGAEFIEDCGEKECVLLHLLVSFLKNNLKKVLAFSDKGGYNDKQSRCQGF